MSSISSLGRPGSEASLAVNLFLLVACAAVGTAHAVGHDAEGRSVLLRKESGSLERELGAQGWGAQAPEARAAATRKAGFAESTRLDVMTATALAEGAAVRRFEHEVPLLSLEEHGCNNCCNDGDQLTPCVDLKKCAERGPEQGKYAFVLTQAGNVGNPETFLPNIEAMRKEARTRNIDVLLLIQKSFATQLTARHKRILDDNGIKVREVEWAVPPDMLWTRKENWCGLQDLIRLHVLGLEGYDAVAYYDSDVQMQGDVLDVFRCAASGMFLSTSGGTGEPFNVGFFAARPDPRLLNAARIFARRANFSEMTGWGGSGYAPSNGYFVGAECGQGFFHTLYYKKSSTIAQDALKEAGLGAPGALLAGQIDRCVWNYQTSFQCKQDFDCSRVRAHHKPSTIRRGSDPNECMKRPKHV